MKVAQPQARMVLFLAVSHLHAAALLAGIPGASLQEMLDAHPALRAFYDGERLSAVAGCPLAGDSDPVTTTEAFVQAFLAEHSDIFGVEGLEVSPAKEVTLSSGKRVFTFVQEMTMPGEGPIPVHGGILKLVVQPGSTEYIAYAGLRLVSRPGDPLPADVITPGEAVSVVAGNPAYQHLSTFGSPDRVIYEDEIGVVHRVYRFHGSGAREAYLFFVDTASAELVGIESQVYDAGISACILGHATPGTAAGEPAEEPVPLPGVRVSVNGDEFSSDAQTGCFDYAIPPGQSLTVTSSLVSEWVRVENSAGPNLTVTAGPFGYPNYDIEMIFNDPTTVPRDQATAQVNAFLVIQKTHDWFKALQPGSIHVDHQLPAVVNFRHPTDPRFMCNAFFSPAERMVVFGIGGVLPFPFFGECNNPSYSTIGSHEYGHYIVWQVVGDAADAAFHEGIADVVATYLWKTSIVGEDFFISPPGFGSRDLDSEIVTLCECHSLDCEQECGDPHYTGLALGGAFWDLRRLLSHCSQTSAQNCAGDSDCPGGETCVDDGTAERLFADFLFVSDGGHDQTVVGELLFVDDDDADLSTPSAHFEQIRQAFETRGWEMPSVYPPTTAQVKVSWEGPPPPAQPVEGIDYTVDYSVVPWNVTLLTTQVGSSSVEKYFVGREPHNTTGAGNLGTVSADWDAPAGNDIIVEIGTDSSAPVRSLRGAEISRQSSANWSSVRLSLSGELASLVRPEASGAGVGGCVSGTLGGNFNGRVEARAVGEGASQPAVLQPLGELPLGTIRLQTLPQGSELLAPSFHFPMRRLIEILDDVSGRIAVGQIIAHPFPGFSDGAIRIAGSLTSTGDVSVGGMVGTAEVSIGGLVSGSVDLGYMSVFFGQQPLVQFGSLLGSVLYRFDQDGILRFGEYGPSSGTILVNGHLFGTVSVDADFSGNLRADADEDGVGDITGSVTIHGLFSGDICGANLVQPAPLPSNIQIPDFSCSGTVCGQPPVCSTGVTVAGVGSRYLKITPSVAGGCARAMAINGFAGSFGTDTSCVAGFVDPATRRLISSPAGQSTQRWGEIYVTGEELVPLGGYSVRGASCDGTPLGNSGSAYLWGYADATNDGIVEIGDVLCILAVYADRDFIEGNCSFYSANIAPCDIDDMVDVTDLLAVLAAYSNPANPCPPPCGSSAMGGEEGFVFDGGESLGGFGGGFTFNSVWVSGTAPTTINPGGTVTVRAFVYGPEDLRGYQVGLQISGGSAGSLTVESLNVETSRNDFVYYEMDPVIATNLSAARLAAAPFEGSAYVGEDNMYLGRFILRASNDAAGTFAVQVRASDTTLRNSDNQALDYWIGSGVQVTIENP